MKVMLPLLAILGVVLLCVQAQGISLASNAKTNYVIVIPAKPLPVEVTAAKELQEHLNIMTGAYFKILREDEIGSHSKLILVGQTSMGKKLLAGTNWDALGHDGIILYTVKDKLVLTGGAKRGTLYAVYTFLEDHLGVRWWSHNERHVPNKPQLTIPSLNYKYIPKILSREGHFYEPNRYGVYAARMKQTGHFHPVPDEYGGRYRLIGWCHTFYSLIPPDKYFDEHPEWFSLINGERKNGQYQLCLSNDEMRKELVKNALEWIRKDPEAGIISISQNDWLGQCQCPDCKAVDEREGSPSGSMVYFVNKVADEINKEFPDFLIETLAYQYTRKAPKYAKPGKNVLIRLCSIECDYGQPMSAAVNESFKKDLEEWSAISHNLFIWSYVALFSNYMCPNPCLPVYGPNIRMFEQNKTVGVFMQADAYNEASCFVRLRSWVNAHLLWNPHQNENALVEDFMDGYYGPASPYLKDYLKLIENAYQKRIGLNWMTPEYIFEANKLFDDAEAAVKSDPELWERVNRERIPVEYLSIVNYRELEFYCEENNLPYPGPTDITKAVDLFEAKTNKYNVWYYKENGLLEPMLNRWRVPRLKIGAKVVPPTELGDLGEKKYIDAQENSFLLWQEGKLVTLVEDPPASNSAAIKQSGEGTIWAIQLKVSEAMEGKHRVYVSFRIEAAEGTTDSAVNVGMYDENNKKLLLEKYVKAENLATDKYTLVDLGSWDLKTGMYFYVAPVNRPNQVQAIYTDRFFLVAE